MSTMMFNSSVNDTYLGDTDLDDGFHEYEKSLLAFLRRHNLENRESFLIKNIKRLRYSLKVTCSHDVVVYIDHAESPEKFFENIEEIGCGYLSDCINIEYYEFFKYLFSRYQNEEIVNRFFNEFS